MKYILLEKPHKNIMYCAVKVVPVALILKKHITVRACLNLVRLFLCDDALHNLECLHVRFTFLCVLIQQNLG